MHPIHSGTTGGRIARAALLAILINGFAVAYLWDGYAGYARDNVKVVVESLGLPTDPLPTIDPELTEAEGPRLAREMADAGAAAAVTARLGEPALRHGDDVYYFGPAGHLRLKTAEARVVGADWKDGAHSASDLKWQRWIGYVLALVGLVTIVHFVRVVTTRVTLTEDGLRIGRRPAIPFEAITGLSVSSGGKDEVANVEYNLKGQSGAVRLDSYVVKEVPAIAAAIRERKGFPASSGTTGELTGEAKTTGESH